MRILHITPRFWPAVGGAEELLGQVSRRLVAGGHQVTVATTDARSANLLWDPRGSRLQTTEEEIEGVRILRFPLRHLPAAPLSYSAVRRLLWLMNGVATIPTSWLEAAASYTPWLPGLAEWLAAVDETFDLVMAMNIAFESLILQAARYANRRQIPFVCFPLTHLGCEAVPGQDALGSFYTMRHQIHLARQSSALLAMTPTEAAFYQARGVPPEKITVIGSAIDQAVLKGGDEARFRHKYHLEHPFAFSIGTLCYDKGTLHTLAAMQSLWEAGHTFDLVLAGAVMQDVERALGHLPEDLRRRVHLLGVISQQDKNDLLAAGDLLVLPSRTESFGTVYLEAWCYGKPVIGARTWGVQDVIHEGEDGCLVPFGDSGRLAGTILQLLSSPETLRRMGNSGKARVADYTWDKRYPLLCDAYQRVYEMRRCHALSG
ncbi:MAG: glycosyltransferase family 4 protein [Chloroflexi bacterium]|nr:glycosyltransferase family 4 protein [Chloroflexota bacterium]